MTIRRKSQDEIKRNRAARTVREQALRSKKTARYVILVDCDGYVLQSWRNKNYRLNVITVIGPYTNHSIASFPEAILLEIGIGKLYPYCCATSKGRITQRQQHATASLKMIHHFWPTLISMIIFHAQEVIQSWSRISHETGVKSTVLFNEENIHYARLKGIRFSVKHTSDLSADQILFASVLQSERALRQVPLDADMKLRADLLDKLLIPYGEELFTKEWFAKQLRVRGRKNTIAPAFELIENRELLPHQWAILFQKMKGGASEKLFYAMLRHSDFDLDMEKIRRWGKKLTEENIPLFPHEEVYIWLPPRRYNSRVKNGPSNRDANVVVEVIPKKAFEMRSDQQYGNLEGLKTIPSFLWNRPDHELI